jgi:Transglycosylase SLT domain
MEKRPEKTLPRTLVCGVFSAKLLTVVVLFAPALLAFKSVSEQTTAAKPVPVEAPVAIVEKPRPRELVRIFSIIRAHRPQTSEEETWQVSEVILDECAKRKIDPLLVLALIQVESGFHTTAVSPAGARGIMQIMPDTARALTHRVGREYGIRPAAFTPEALDDPLLNIRLGVYYLHGLKSQFQDLVLTLSAYNFGPVELQNRLDNNLDYATEFTAAVLDAYQRYQHSRHPSF